MATKGHHQKVTPAPVFDDWPGASAVQFADAGEILERLDTAVGERDRHGATVEKLVVMGRRRGLTWTQLAGVLGVSPQAVQKKYGESI